MNAIVTFLLQWNSSSLFFLAKFSVVFFFLEIQICQDLSQIDQFLTASRKFRRRLVFSGQNLPSFEHHPANILHVFLYFLFLESIVPSVCPLFFCFSWFNSALLFYIIYSRKKIYLPDILPFKCCIEGFLTVFLGSFVLFYQVYCSLYTPCSSASLHG